MMLTFRIPEYDQDLATRILTRISNGETLTAVLQDQNMPTPDAIYRWMNDKPAFSLAYNRARREQMRTWADQIILLADDGSQDMVKGAGKKPVLDRPHFERIRLMIETRKWLMSKLNPAEFGDPGSVAAGGPVLGAVNPRELVGQAVHLLGQFGVVLTPEQVTAVIEAITQGDAETQAIGHV